MEMEYSIENDKRELTIVSRTDDILGGEQKKPHWLDPRSCPLCNRVYSNLSNLRQHMKLIHNPTLVTCKLCYKTFKTDLYLRRHLIR
ncbi:hypothetical protein Phum_PHUM053540 [Pediculus humanus corporis]|uniref:C2H2-type domain-containing protein n=1 Tax=Pediculus humanus subsp. corporis TaxID=121224 RepID=E0VB72_PEDHC|nr:uncharacterized protein Phum_PHUM053540 [Pediculus humanus corporis]EEB10628.1 hypothetical protein Phum_PHUM053540 [Pediculus humanus corporis]